MVECHSQKQGGSLESCHTFIFKASLELRIVGLALQLTRPGVRMNGLASSTGNLPRKHHYPFPTYRRILILLKQTSFENIVAKGEFAHDEQFHLWPLCFHLYYKIKAFFDGDISCFCKYVFEVVCCRFDV